MSIGKAFSSERYTIIRNNNKETSDIFEFYYDTKKITHFSIPANGFALSACHNSGGEILWVIDNEITIINFDDQEGVFLERPQEGIVLHHIKHYGNAMYMTGSEATAFQFIGGEFPWERVGPHNELPAILQEEEETVDEYQARRSKIFKAHLNENPDIYGSERIGDHMYFYGNLGYVAIKKDELLKGIRVEENVFFVNGVSDGKENLYLASRTAGHNLYFGNDKNGFKKVLDLQENWYTLICRLDDIIYIGADDSSEGHSLFTYENGNLKPVFTGLIEEPKALIALESIDGVIWAVDHAYIYRFDGTQWERFEYYS